MSRKQEWMSSMDNESFAPWPLLHETPLSLERKWQEMLAGHRPTFYLGSNKELRELKRYLAQKGVARWVRKDEDADVCCDFLPLDTFSWRPWHLLRRFIKKGEADV